jgi:hypothetical protein
MFNGPWVLAYFGPIKPAQFSQFCKASVSSPNNSLPPTATTFRCRQAAAAVVHRLQPPPSCQTPTTFPMNSKRKKKKKKKIENPYFEFLYVYFVVICGSIHWRNLAQNG